MARQGITISDPLKQDVYGGEMKIRYRSRRRGWVKILLLLVLVSLGSGLGYVVWQVQRTPDPTSIPVLRAEKPLDKIKHKPADDGTAPLPPQAKEVYKAIERSPENPDQTKVLPLPEAPDLPLEEPSLEPPPQPAFSDPSLQGAATPQSRSQLMARLAPTQTRLQPLPSSNPVIFLPSPLETHASKPTKEDALGPHGTIVAQALPPKPHTPPRYQRYLKQDLYGALLQTQRRIQAQATKMLTEEETLGKKLPPLQQTLAQKESKASLRIVKDIPPGPVTVPKNVFIELQTFPVKEAAQATWYALSNQSRLPMITAGYSHRIYRQKNAPAHQRYALQVGPLPYEQALDMLRALNAQGIKGRLVTP
jgi:hypothetical protein